MHEIEKLLIGHLEMKEFLKLLKADSCLQLAVNSLIPKDSINDPEFPLWKRISYSSLNKYNFDFVRLLNEMFRFDDSIADNLNVFSMIRTFYCYQHPEMICTTKYDDAFGLYLDTVKDCFDGPEVNYLVQQIIQNALIHHTKKKRIEQARTEVMSLFHVIDKQRPRWIQGPEWPMGKFSPMQFLSQKRNKENVQYLFRDVDCNNRRIITQYY